LEASSDWSADDGDADDNILSKTFVAWFDVSCNGYTELVTLRRVVVAVVALDEEAGFRELDGNN
jgi:hypothetical protein